MAKRYSILCKMENGKLKKYKHKGYADWQIKSARKHVRNLVKALIEDKLKGVVYVTLCLESDTDMEKKIAEFLAGE
jgi:hypothetical protein